MTGLVVGLEANRPTVLADNGQRYLCYLRGRIQRDLGRIMVGDQVGLEATDPGEAIITQVAMRKNTLLRPPLANVTGMFIVFTLTEPSGNRQLLDKRLVLAEMSEMAAEIVINKVDLATEGELEEIRSMSLVYARAGYPLWTISSQSGRGLKPMLDAPRQGTWVLVGESGVGKSTLLASTLPEASFAVQGLSRGGRGKETTRRVTLFRVQNFWLADAPGYTSLRLEVKDARDLARAFPEFSKYHCRYTDCRHVKEPGCGVLEAVQAGNMDNYRYRHYVTMLEDQGRIQF